MTALAIGATLAASMFAIPTIAWEIGQSDRAVAMVQAGALTAAAFALPFFLIACA